MNIALFGYGNVGRGFAQLLEKQKTAYPFRIVAVHTGRHGTAYNLKGVPLEPEFGPPAVSPEEFLDNSQAEIVVEITSLSPHDGQPAIRHIQSAFARGMHVITANKGPIAHAYRDLANAARARQLMFRFESIVMDGAPIFNMVRHSLPGIAIHGFSTVCNSTTQMILEAMRGGVSLAEGILQAQAEGIAEADPSYDIDGWDSAAKAAALANVLMDASVTPLDVERSGIGDLTPALLAAMEGASKRVALVARAWHDGEGLKLRVKPEILDLTDPLARLYGTSNLLQLETDHMGTLGILELNPAVEQTAYGLFADLVDIARSI